MAGIPLQVILDIHDLSRRNPGKWVSRGRGYEAYTYPDGRFKLTHYGTVIFSIDPSTRRYTLGGYSQSDRDAVSSMMHIYGIQDRATNRGGKQITARSTGATEGSYNKRKSASRNATPGASSASKELSRHGYELVREDVTGRDPEMKYVESVVIGKRRSDSRYAVWYGIDWTKHPNAADRSRGYSLQQGAYDLTKTEADREAADRRRRSQRYNWEPVSKSANSKSGNTKKRRSNEYNGSPRPNPDQYRDAPYASRTVGGHTILKVFYDPWESRYMDRPVYDVVARRDDIPGLIWGKDYDPNSGLWNGGDYDQTIEKVERHAEGHRLVASYNAIGDAYRKARAEREIAKKEVRPPKNHSTSKQGAKSGSGKKAQSSKCVRKKTTATSKPKTAPKKTSSNQRKPASRGGRR